METEIQHTPGLGIKGACRFGGTCYSIYCGNGIYDALPSEEKERLWQAGYHFNGHYRTEAAIAKAEGN